ncbi:DUF397 domain-containing protein [Streptomyces sp. NPDC020801]|uniref:DUF397 domain-containing protein n=1 Tax=Streptomyces sp. NPDC020801 TaxID=3365093 RepID=UPI0037B19923
MGNSDQHPRELPWFKSSASSGSGGCVEVAVVAASVAVRDSKVADGPRFYVGADAFAALISGVVGGTI